jgi:hypothetical protein
MSRAVAIGKEPHRRIPSQARAVRSIGQSRRQRRAGKCAGARALLICASSAFPASPAPVAGASHLTARPSPPLRACGKVELLQGSRVRGPLGKASNASRTSCPRGMARTTAASPSACRCRAPSRSSSKASCALSAPLLGGNRAPGLSPVLIRWRRLSCERRAWPNHGPGTASIP